LRQRSLSSAVAELTLIVSSYSSPGFEAWAWQASGEVLLAQEKYPEALGRMRDTIRRWQELDGPYYVARARVLAAHAYRALADHEAADFELCFLLRSVGGALWGRLLAKVSDSPGSASVN
jgi:hypothetical protein